MDPPSTPVTPFGSRSAGRAGALELGVGDLTPIAKRGPASSSSQPVVIGLIGPACAGKTTIADFLVNKLGFARADASTRDPKLLVDDIMDGMQWRKPWVIDGLCTLDDVRMFRKRPLFYLVAVDAPTLERYRRATARRPDEPLSLQQFLEADDAALYGAHDGSRPGIREAMPYASVRLMNDGTVEQFLRRVAEADLLNTEHVRPSWDSYFMRLAELASQRSNCMKRRVGAIIARENRVVSSGYNGTPRGCLNCNEGGCGRCNGNARAGTALDECLCLHAEENAIMEAGRERATGSVLYTSLLPCLGCTKKIIQAGVREVVFSAAYADHVDGVSRRLMADAGVRIRQHAPGRPADLDDSFSELCAL